MASQGAQELTVQYFCSCREVERLDIPEFLDDDTCFQPLEYLYFCEDCGSVRCRLCVDKEPVSLYCPSCLFETTPAAAAQAGNICVRNCLSCPKCTANLVPQSELVDGEKKFGLNCAVCDYELRYLHSSSSLVSQVLEKRPNVDIYNFVLQAFKAGKPFPLGPPDTTHPSFPDSEEMLPQPVKLRAKYKKQCKSCRNTLILPDPRPTLAKFKSKSMAVEMLPRIDAAKNDTGSRISLMFSNPVPVEITVALALAPNSSTATLLTTSFSIGPDSGKLDEMSLLRQVPQSYITRETNASRKVFMESSSRQTNWTQVEMELPENLDLTRGIFMTSSVKFGSDASSPEVVSWFRITADR